MLIVWFLLGFVGLLLLIGLFQLFRSFDISKLAVGLRWTGAGVLLGAAVACLLLSKVAPGVFLALLAAGLAGGLPLRLAARLRRAVDRWAGHPEEEAPTSPISVIETSHLRMRVDRDHGPLAGSVLDGHFGGRTLVEMTDEEVLALLADLRQADQAGARLLEAWMDRVLGSGWRHKVGSGAEAAHASSRQQADDERPMTPEDAFSALGLKPGADDQEVREAHRRLMRQAHPDAGGSDVRAARLNVAKDLLLKERDGR
jgi:hypothetical protein